MIVRILVDLKLHIFRFSTYSIVKLFFITIATHGYGPSLKRKKNLETLIDWEEKMKIMYAACFRVTRL